MRPSQRVCLGVRKIPLVGFTGLGSFPNRTCVFQLGGKRLGKVRKHSLSFYLFSLTSQLNKPQLSFSLQYVSPNPRKGWCYQQGSLNSTGAPTPTPVLQPVLFPALFLAQQGSPKYLKRDLLLGKLRNAPTQFSAERPGTGLAPTSLPGRREDDLNQKLKSYEEQSGSASRF